MREAALKDLLRECSAFITEKTQEIYNLVPGDGDSKSPIMVITSYPSAKEEMTGIYFEGSAGRAYDSFLGKLDYKREEVYTTYTVKYRPYKISEKSGRIVNRDVTAEEIKMFYPYLVSEIEVIDPKVIIVLGDLAFSAIHNMAQEKGAEYGSLVPIKINEHYYDLIAMPHPNDGNFSKVVLTEDAIKSCKQADDLDLPSSGFVNLEDVYEPLEEPVDVIGPVPKVVPVYNTKDMPLPKRRKNKISGKHKVVLVYGGSQLANDPTYVVVERISNVLTELNVTIKRIDLYKNSYNMNEFFEELSESDGVILASTVEWYGIGGLMQTFLDQAYMGNQFDIFEGTYLFGVVVSRQGFERDALNHMIKSWEILGGIEGVNLCASINSSADIETNKDLLFAIDKKAEDFYRFINQQRIAMPTSIHENKVMIKVPVSSEVDKGEQMYMNQVMNPVKKEETYDNQMSFISNYDEFIEQQQKDIEDIASLFKERMSTKTSVQNKTIPELFEYKYKPDKSFGDCKISWVVNDASNENFLLDFNGASLKAKQGKKMDADVVISSNYDVLKKITESKLTVQRAFMTGEIKAKGNFTLLYKLDQLFAF